MTRGYDQMTRARGVFVPDSDERRLRHENANRGMRTCYFAACLTAFDPAEVVHRPARSSRRLPWWSFYCCREHAVLDGHLRDRRRFVTVSEDADGEMVVVLDFGRCRGCPA